MAAIRLKGHEKFHLEKGGLQKVSMELIKTQRYLPVMKELTSWVLEPTW